MANLDGTPSDLGWDLDRPRTGPRRGSGWRPRDSNRLLGLSEEILRVQDPSKIAKIILREFFSE